MLHNALLLAERGFRVFPVRQNSKLPAIKDWPNQATSGTVQINRWWRGTSYNIGIVPGPDYIVLDVDPRHGGWKVSLTKLRSLGLPLSTMTVKTPGGGFHLYYTHPGGGVIKASDAGWKAEFPGIDIRADNAYVLGPGSTIDGVEYVEVEK